MDPQSSDSWEAQMLILSSAGGWKWWTNTELNLPLCIHDRSDNFLSKLLHGGARADNTIGVHFHKMSWLILDWVVLIFLFCPCFRQRKADHTWWAAFPLICLLLMSSTLLFHLTKRSEWSQKVQPRRKEQRTGCRICRDWRKKISANLTTFCSHLPQTIYNCLFWWSVIQKSFEYSQQSQANSWKLNKDEWHQTLCRNSNGEAELLMKKVVICGSLSPRFTKWRLRATDWWQVIKTA